MARVGPARLTLAHVAADVGLAPATLVQRFGSKRRLLLKLAQEGCGSVDACFSAARARHRSPVAALLAAMTEVARFMKTPEEMANSLAFLQIDLTDPDFHRIALENSALARKGIRQLLDAAVDAGELLPCRTAALARAVQVTCNGSLITWAIHREGAVRAWLRHDLEELLRPYRARKARTGIHRTKRTRR
jgi:AcrR family transcriptional regulator